MTIRCSSRNLRGRRVAKSTVARRSNTRPADTATDITASGSEPDDPTTSRPHKNTRRASSARCYRGRFFGNRRPSRHPLRTPLGIPTGSPQSTESHVPRWLRDAHSHTPRSPSIAPHIPLDPGTPVVGLGEGARAREGEIRRRRSRKASRVYRALSLERLDTAKLRYGR